MRSPSLRGGCGKHCEVPISSLIIDGYNLMGVQHQDLEARRERLIDLLIGYGRRKGHRIIVVFDGWKDGRGFESSSVRGGVKVIFSRLGERADSVIKRLVSSERMEWIVVTSDREIADYAWASGSIPIRSEVFLPFLQVGTSKTGEDALDNSDSGKDEEEEEASRRRKGNPRRPSRKEKAIQRALARL